MLTEMDGIIPKENLTAYERWELAAFDEQQEAERNKTAASAATAATLPTLPTVEEIEHIRAAAQSAGHQEGLQRGIADGRIAGEAQGRATLAAEIARFTELLENQRRAFDALEEAIAAEVLDLALTIAKQVIRNSLRANPALMLPTVREAMGALVSQHGHPTVILNPADATMIREALGDTLQHTGWRVIDDPSVERGGCRVENGGSEVDATLATRWHRVVDGLGGRIDWLDDEAEKPR